MARRKVTTTVYIEAEQDRLLKALSSRTQVPVAEYIREGIDLVLEAHRAELPGQLQLFGGDEDPDADHAVLTVPEERRAAYRRSLDDEE